METSSTQSSQTPLISVVIPALNEESLLGRCLESLFSQVCFFNYEVIVVDNGSTDHTVEIANRFGAKVIREERRGIGWARAIGFAQARGDIIASTDADTVVPNDWLVRFARLFREYPDVVGVGGGFVYIDGPLGVRLLGRLANILTPIISILLPQLWSFSGFNFAVRRKTYLDSGGFRTDMTYGEDWDLGKRIGRLGRVVIDYKSRVKTSGRASERDILCIRRIINYFSLVLFGRIFMLPLTRSKSDSSSKLLE